MHKTVGRSPTIKNQKPYHRGHKESQRFPFKNLLREPLFPLWLKGFDLYLRIQLGCIKPLVVRQQQNQKPYHRGHKESQSFSFKNLLREPLCPLWLKGFDLYLRIQLGCHKTVGRSPTIKIKSLTTEGTKNHRVFPSRTSSVNLCVLCG